MGRELKKTDSHKSPRLSEREEHSLALYKTTNQPALGPDLQEEMFKAFMSGFTCEQIFDSYKKEHALGAIVEARLSGEWDARIRSYAADMVEKTKNKIAMANASAIDMMTSLLTAMSQTSMKKIVKYAASGNPDDLGEFQIAGKSMQGMMELTEFINKFNENITSEEPTIEVLTTEVVETKEIKETGSISDLIKKLNPGKK